jgi:transposase-like protein
LDEKLIAHHMRTLKCTREEAIQLIADDRDTDRGIAKPWDLSPEQMKNARKLANAGTRKVTKPTKPRERNPDMFKQAVISAVAQMLEHADGVVKVEISNRERTVDFIHENGSTYTLTLTAHRAKK